MSVVFVFVFVFEALLLLILEVDNFKHVKRNFFVFLRFFCLRFLY